MGCPAQHPAPTLGGDERASAHPEEEAHQAGRPVDDCSIDHLPLARAFAFIERSKDPEGAIHRTAAEIADEILRRGRRLARLADGRQRAGDGDIIDVVPCSVGERAVLSPAGHACIDEARVEAQELVRPQPQPLHHAGTEALDQHIGLGHGSAAEGLAFLALEIEADAVARPFDHRVGRSSARPVDPHHLGTKIGKQHRDVRPGANTAEFDHPEAGKRPCWLVHLCLPSTRANKSRAGRAILSSPCIPVGLLLRGSLWPAQ